MIGSIVKKILVFARERLVRHRKVGFCECLFCFSLLYVSSSAGRNLGPAFFYRPYLSVYSYCAKTTFPLEKAIDEVVFAKFYLVFTVLSRVAELLIYIVIFMRQTEIESRASPYVIKDDEPVSYRR